MFIKNENKILKDDNKVLKDKIKALEDKAKKAEACNNEALMGKITEVGTAIGDLARSDTPIEETTSVKRTIRELTEEVKKSNRSVAECAKIGKKFDNFLRDNQSPRTRKDSKRRRRDNSQSPPPSIDPNPPAPAPTTIMLTIATPQTGATPTNLPRGDVQIGQVIREGSLATTVMGQNGRPALQAPNNSGTRIRDTNDNNTRAPRGTPPAQNSYANAAASAPATIPGLNMASQRASHTQNNRGANQAPNNNKQPKVVRDDHFKLCPDTGNFQKVERFKTVQTKSDKQKSRENKRHEKDLAQVMKELVYFGIPTRDQNGVIMTKDQDKTRVAKFLRELKRGGYTTKNGDVTSTVRQWKNTRHPDHIPITITFANEDVRILAAEAATELELLGSRTPRDSDREHDRIGYVRKLLTERERKDLRLRREKRNSPEGVAFTEMKRREENSHADADDWAGFQLEEEDGGPVDGYPGGPVNGHPGGAALHEPNNNAATALEEMMRKMQKLQENYDRLKSGQEAAKVDRETEGESDFDLQDPFSSHSVMEQGTPRHTAVGGPPATLPNMFDAVPFDATNNLNLANPNIRDQIPQENGNTNHMTQNTTTPARGEDVTSDSECKTID